ncbi:MAG: hypothetical protein KAT65_15150 [Methanophagales archaeon]|nr:hypothetical protein [Methanophagales archaeon]
MVKTNSNEEDKDRGIFGTLVQALFMYIPAAVILVIALFLIFGIIFSVRILLTLLVNTLYIAVYAPDRCAFIVALASVIEFGLFVAMTYIITLGLYSSIIKPFITEKHIELNSILTAFAEKVGRPFLTIVVSILAIYILEIATGIISSMEGPPLNYDDLYCKMVALVLFAIVAVIISIIIRLEK